MADSTRFWSPATSSSTAATRISKTPSGGRRRWAHAGIDYLGVGISGGESGARTRPEPDAGRAADAYEAVRPIFEAIAASADGAPCVAYLGRAPPATTSRWCTTASSTGDAADRRELRAHEAGAGARQRPLAEVYAEWQAGELKSYLLEITAAIFRRATRRPAAFWST